MVWRRSIYLVLPETPVRNAFFHLHMRIVHWAFFCLRKYNKFADSADPPRQIMKRKLAWFAVTDGMQEMIRARIALSLQAILAAGCVLALRTYAHPFISHPVGLMEHVYRWAPTVSLLLLLWVFVEIAAGRIQTWKCFVVLMASLLLLGIVFVSTTELLIRC
jgi:hypothetical protein